MSLPIDWLPIDKETTSAVLFDAGGTLLHVGYQVFVDVAHGRGYRADARAIRLAEAAERIAIDQRWEESGGAIGADASRAARYFRGLLANSEIPISDHRPDGNLPWARSPDHPGPARIAGAGGRRRELT